MKLKLFVWEGVLTDYTSGIMFAIAKDAREARLKIFDKSLTDLNVDVNERKNRLAQFKKLLDGKMTKEEFGLKEYDDTMESELLEEPYVANTAEGFYCYGGG